MKQVFTSLNEVKEFLKLIEFTKYQKIFLYPWDVSSEKYEVMIILNDKNDTSFTIIYLIFKEVIKYLNGLHKIEDQNLSMKQLFRIYFERNINL